MTIEHVLIEDPNIHEPKGVASATAGSVYVADGAGSGDWDSPTLLTPGKRKGLTLTTDGAGSSSFDEVVWKDILGEIHTRGVASDPAFSAFRTNVYGYAFTAGEIVYLAFHIPHDYAPGTDLYFHVHWGHNAGTSVSGNMVWTYDISYSKGHNQAIFPAPVTGTITYNTVNIGTTPQYRHRIDEVQISATSPSASQLNTDNIEVDGIILIQLTATTIPTLTTSSPASSVYLFYADLHYQATGIGTTNKSPDFYT